MRRHDEKWHVLFIVAAIGMREKLSSDGISIWRPIKEAGRTGAVLTSCRRAHSRLGKRHMLLRDSSRYLRRALIIGTCGARELLGVTATLEIIGTAFVHGIMALYRCRPISEKHRWLA